MIFSGASFLALRTMALSGLDSAGLLQMLLLHRVA